MKTTVAQIARILGAAAPGDDSLVTGVAIDSRQVGKGDLFAALKGEYRDGHDFALDALRRGASAVLTELELPLEGCQIVVPDVAKALLKLSGWVRDTIDPIVVGITGSTGKTTTKDLLASVCATRFSTVAAERSFNNELGVPLTLLRTKVGTEVVVCEMGARGPGHIAALCNVARPQVGVVTNVGVTHFEQFGSHASIVSAKGELIESLPQDGAAVLNADDPGVARMARRSSAQVYTFGLTDAWVSADSISLDRHGRARFRLVHAGRKPWVELRMSGKHQVRNALAAATAGLCLGVDLEACAAGLEAATSSPWRMQVEVVEDVMYVNDAYNASPTSVAAALETCAEMAKGGRLVAVLGYMAELGELGPSEHQRIGALAAAVVDRLIVVGDRAKDMAQGGRSAGGDPILVDDEAGALDAIGPLAPGDVLLVKGSRVAGLEELAGLASARSSR